MNNKKLRGICDEVIQFEEQLMFGEIYFSYDRLLTAMRAGHPAEILDALLAPVFLPLLIDEEVGEEKVIQLYKDLATFKNEFQIAEMTPIVQKLKAFLDESGIEVIASKMKLDELKKEFIGKTLNRERFRNAGEVWNLEIKDGHLLGHFYWNDIRHRYFDKFSIKVDENMTIEDIDPLSTHTAEHGIRPCRFTLVHNGEFAKLLRAGTSEDQKEN